MATQQLISMTNEDSKQQSQTSQQQPKQSQRDTTDNSQNRKSEPGENKTNPQDVSKKNPVQGGGSTQDHGKDKATHDKHEKAS